MAGFYSFFISFLIFLLSHSITIGIPIREDNNVKASKFLEHNGYLDTRFQLRKVNDSSETGEFKDALKAFQRFTGLNETGELDKATIEQMHKPKCGLPDIVPHSQRPKRYVVHTYKWSVQDLIYKIYKNSAHLSVSDTNTGLQKAFQLWSTAAQINFKDSSTSPLSPVNIAIGFYVNAHGDNDAFDGEGGTLAHAFFPPFGDLHFDDAENFTLNTVNGTNFLSVATHELGHSLGMEHTPIQDAVMYPYYQPYVPNTEYKLHSDDIAGIQYLYGARGSNTGGGGSVATTPSGEPAWRYPGTVICQSNSIDAIYHDSDKDITTLFKGTQYWEMDYYGVKQGYPKHIQLTWATLPTDIDAALFWPANSALGFQATVYVFKDSTVYTMVNNQVVSGSPISRVFPGLPDTIDSAVAITNENVTYFTKGQDLYYCNMYETNSIKPASPNVARWDLTSVNASVYYKGYMYLFVNGLYYGYDSNGKVLKGYPKSLVNDWHGCTGNIPRESERGGNGAEGIGYTLSLTITLLMLCVQTWL